MAVVRAQPRQVPGRARLRHAVDREPRQRPHRPLSPRASARPLSPAPSCRRSPASTCARRRRKRAAGCRRCWSTAIAETLARGQQSLLFLNRRGYAPLTLCRSLRPSLRMPAVHGLAGRASLPPPAQLPPLRLLAAAPRDVPEVRRGGLARRLRPGRRARRRGSGRALSRSARCALLSSDLIPGLDRNARDHPLDRGRRGRHHHRHADRGQGPPLPRISTPSASSTAISASAWAPIRAPASAPSSCCIR